MFMFTGQAMPAHDAVPLARRHVHRALELDPTLPEAHCVLGSIAAMYDFDWKEADRRFWLAFAQGKPSHAVRVHRANIFLAHAGRGREAVEDMEQTVREDPLSWGSTAYERNATLPAAVGQLAGVLARTGNDARATALVDRLQPGTAFGGPFGLALYYLAINDFDKCADWLEKAIDQRDLWVSFLLNVGNIGGRAMWSSPRWPRLAQLMNVSPARSLT